MSIKKFENKKNSTDNVNYYEKKKGRPMNSAS